MLDTFKKFNSYNLKLFLKYSYEIIIFVVITIIGYLSIPYLEKMHHYAQLKQKHGNQLLQGIDAYKMKHDFDYIIDVRTKEEFNKGHLENAININHNELLENHEILFNHYKITKDDVIFIYCVSGTRASKVVDKLNENNYNKTKLFFTNNNVELLGKSGFNVKK